MEEEVRTKLKWNFLKNIILRLDFEKIDDGILNEIISNIGPVVKSYSLDRRFERINSDIEVKLPETGTDITSQIRNRYKVFCFVNDAKGLSLELSKSAILITINSSAYIPFDYYSSLLSEVLELFNCYSQSIILKRVGLRKINKCLLNSVSKVYEVIKNDILSMPSWNCNQIPLNFTQKESFAFGDLKANIIQQLLPGRIEETAWYQYVLDLDVYCDSSEIVTSGMSSGNLCVDLNNSLFEMFIKALNPEFVSSLMCEDFSDDNVLGVEPNG